jgi:hypothetical protein
MGVVMERWCPTQQMLGVFLRRLLVKKLLTACSALVALTLPAHTEDQKSHTNWPTQQEMMEGVKINERTRTAFAGKTLMLDALLYLSFDCSVLETDITVSQKPEHGDATVQIVKRQTGYVGGYEKCNRVWPVPTITYKAAPGFSGTDTFEVTSVSVSTGFTSIWRYTINVVDRNQKPVTIVPMQKSKPTGI